MRQLQSSLVIRLLQMLAFTLIALSASAQEQQDSAEPPTPAPTVVAKGSGHFGSVNPEDLNPPLSALMGNAFTHWLTRERIRLYGWVDGGYTYSSIGHGLLSMPNGRPGIPTVNRFGNEVILNGAWFIVDRLPSKEDWDWGFRADFYAGNDASLLQPLHGFGPNTTHLATDYRQAYLSVHAPVLSEGGVDLQVGRLNMPLGYETLMGPYRQLYSQSYYWIYFQVAATAALATLHATDRLDLLGGVAMNYNTVFQPRGRAPAYIAKVSYNLDPQKKTTLTAAVFTGPEPAPLTSGHLGTWQTVAESHLTHQWSRRLTQVVLVNSSWDASDPVNRHHTSKTYGANSTLTFHALERLDLNTRIEWFRDERGVRTGIPGTFGETTAGVDIMPTRWMNIRPEIRGDFASTNAYGRVGGGPRKRNEMTAALDLILKF